MKGNFKRTIKLTIVFYLITYLIINWPMVSWIFNYETVYGLASDFFTPYPSIASAEANGIFYPNNSALSGEEIASARTQHTENTRNLYIPSLDVSAPIVFSTSFEVPKLEDDLNRGVVYYPGSVKPGQTGNSIILGHSSPPYWPKIKYDWVFTELNDVEIGDKIFIDFENKRYSYIVKDKKIIERGEEVPLDHFDGKNNVLSLVSCWPPGKDQQRIVVQAILEA